MCIKPPKELKDSINVLIFFFLSTEAQLMK